MKALISKPTTTIAPSRLATTIVTHAHFDHAEEAMLESLADPDGAPILFLMGAPGFGKTLLLQRLANKVAWDHRGAMEADPNVRPVVMLEALAPVKGSFDWAIGYKQILEDLGEVGVELRVGDAIDRISALNRQAMNGRIRGVPQLQVDVNNALGTHGTKALFIDEIEHVAYANDVERYQASLDTLKSTANATGCQIVCAGSYAANGFRMLSGQLIRRERPVHLRRYRAEVPAEYKEYARVVAEMCALIDHDGDPMELVRTLYRASFGTIGTTRDLLIQGDHAARYHGETLVRGLARHMRGDDQNEVFARQILEGEALFGDSKSTRARLDKLIGLTGAPTPVVKAKMPTRLKPGHSTPTRYVVGQASGL